MATITGNSGPNNILDTAGNDSINGLAGDDIIRTRFGRDTLDGSTGDDTLRIVWSDATDDIVINGFGTTSYVDNEEFGGYNASTRRAYHLRFEHLVALAGSGDDDIYGIVRSNDTIDGGAGIDRWSDYFDLGGASVGMDVDMTLVSSPGGQSFADGTVVRNIERVNLVLTSYDDSFRDAGNYTDSVSGVAGDDDLGTSYGRDTLDGSTGDDTLTIDWSDATEYAQVYGYGTLSYVNNPGGGGYNAAVRRVYHLRFEHINATTGSADDDLYGIVRGSDTLDGGAGTDRWHDYFDREGATEAMNVVMSRVSSPGGQTFADGSEVRNIESAYLVLTDYDDRFRDAGNYTDSVSGVAGDDDLGTSYGRDTLDGSTGDDTLTIDWSDATEYAQVYGYGTLSYVDTEGYGGYNTSMRRVYHLRFEHIDATTGSGDDDLYGIVRSNDTLNGGAGTDRWSDYFDQDGATEAMDVDMARVSSAGGQRFADGTLVRNIERADLVLTDYDDSFRDSGAYDDYVSGAAGNDDLGTSYGRDTLDGSTGDDTLTIDWSDATDYALVAGYGSTSHVDTEGSGGYNSSVRRLYHLRFEHINATTGSGDDDVYGTQNDDTLNAASGDDVIVGYGGSDIIYGGSGDDSIDGGADADTITGASGDDTVDGGDGSDMAMFGVPSTSILVRVEGDTVIIVSPEGEDRFANVERFNFSDVTLGLAAVRAMAGSGWTEGDNTSETIIGTNGRDTIDALGGNDRVEARGGADSVLGGTGNDTLLGEDGDDMLFGGPGNDVLDGGAGGDFLNGGEGRDTVSYESATRSVRVDLQNDALMYNDAVGDTFSSIEVFQTGNTIDQLRGDAADNEFRTGGLSDRLYGRAGDDLLFGEDGADAFYGGLGADVMTGGAQAGRTDRYIYFNLSESGVGAGNRDIITDFVAGEDRIEISRFDADLTRGGKQQFTFVGDDAFGGSAGELGYRHEGGNTIVQADVTGDGLADFEIQLNGIMDLTAGDFLI